MTHMTHKMEEACRTMEKGFQSMFEEARAFERLRDLANRDWDVIEGVVIGFRLTEDGVVFDAWKADRADEFQHATRSVIVPWSEILDSKMDPLIDRMLWLVNEVKKS